jgi:non-ribosomal peptide synthase protein (TIGR01720 family)
MYRTGDMGRWLANGEIEFLGRNDSQVKIRGYRIELGEIEETIRSLSGVSATAVIVNTTERGTKELVAYVVSDENLTIKKLRHYLSEKLTSYMVPHHFIQLDSLPLNINGKLDRKRLPDIKGSVLSTGTDYVAPGNDVEVALVDVYAEVLKKEKVSVKDDFFSLGGDSIKSIQVVSRLRQRGYILTIRDVLLHPVIEDLGRKVKSVVQVSSQEPVIGTVLLGPIQKRFFERNAEGINHYNQSVLLESTEHISIEGLKTCLDKIVEHHDALRMVYKHIDGEWTQEIESTVHGCPLEVIDSDERFIEHCDRIQSSFQLENGNLFRAALFIGKEKTQLLLVAHHLVIDGVSWRILLEDLSLLYKQYKSKELLQLPLKSDSFKRWMQKQEEYASEDTLINEGHYWDKIENVKVESLPIDFPGGSNTSIDSCSRSFVFDSELTSKLLKDCYKAYRTEINDILLTALGTALEEAFNMSDIVVDMEGHGREDIGKDTDVTRTIGWFTTIYPVLLKGSETDGLLDRLIAVKENLHRVPNKGIGYGILRYTAKKRYHTDSGILFNYLGDFGGGGSSSEEEPLFKFSGGSHGKEVSEKIERGYLLIVSGMVVEEKLRMTISYSDKQYKEETIINLLELYKKGLEELIGLILQEEEEHLSPVDLTFTGLSIQDLEKLKNSI